MNAWDDDFYRGKGAEEDNPLAMQIVSAVASSENVLPTELPPLFEVIDPDALEALFSSELAGPERSDGSVVFIYAGYQVTADRTVSIDAPARPITREE